MFATQYPQKDWHQRLGGGTHADAIMDRIVHNTTWIETGDWDMREHAPRQVTTDQPPRTRTAPAVPNHRITGAVPQ
nr:hypothetical protein [Bifidobacterium felsineum]